jgi:hypothetical protein
MDELSEEVAVDFRASGGLRERIGRSGGKTLARVTLVGILLARKC